MSKKRVLAEAFTFYFLMVLFIGANFHLANCNPSTFLGPPPVQNPTAPPAHSPLITIQSPQNTTYNSNNVLLKIAVSTSPLDAQAELHIIVYYLDGVENTVLNSTYTIGPTSYTWSTPLNLTQGTHTMQVVIYARNYIFFEGQIFSPVVEHDSGKLYFTVASSSDTLLITLEPSSSITPNPSPSSTIESISTPEPTSTPAIKASSVSYTLLYYFIFGFVIIVVVVGFLLYDLRRRKQRVTG